MVDKIHTVASEDFPSATPPSVGAHYVMPNSLFMSIGATTPEDWVLIWGDPQNVGFNAGSEITPARTARLISIAAFDEAGPTAPLTVVTMPQWQGIPYGLEVQVPGVGAGVTVPIDLDFSAIGANCSFDFQGDFAGVTALQDGPVLKLQVTAQVSISFAYMEFSRDGSIIDGIYCSMKVSPLGSYTPVESV